MKQAIFRPVEIPILILIDLFHRVALLIVEAL